jgi:Shedu protein SduA, C-terminal
MLQTDFIVGRDSLEDIQVSPTSSGRFYWFYNSKQRHLIKRFVLAESDEVFHVCEVTLIKKEDRFTPRLHFSVRYRNQPKKIASTQLERSEDSLNVKASVDMGDCHKTFWDLISYFKSMKELAIPDESFSLVTKGAAQIVKAIGMRDPATIKSIITMLSSSPGVAFSEQDVNELLQRRRRLAEFGDGLVKKWSEPLWQSFFERNKWIFGYGLNYVILRMEQSQAHVGGLGLDGSGEKIPDYLASTSGSVRFTVLVEIKTAESHLLAGTAPHRSGAWSLGRDLTDALTQLQASIEEWSHYGSKHPRNKPLLDKGNIHTVKPRLCP